MKEKTKKESAKKIKKRWGDRYDGRRVRRGDPTNVIIPFIMKERNDSEVFFDADVDMSKIDAIIREKRKNGEDARALDYVMAVIVRTISQYPRMNRFVAGRRLYARDKIVVSMVIKRELNVNTPETAVKFEFEPTATVSDISKQIDAVINKTKQADDSNTMDKVMKVLNVLPRFLYMFVIWLFRVLDFFGHLPKIIYQASPFHTGVFVTNMGSIGADPIYHHIYNFGNTSIFIAMGHNRKQRVLDKEGKISERKVMKLRFVADERIADGYYLSVALKYFTGLFSHPEQLEVPPDKVYEDDQL